VATDAALTLVESAEADLFVCLRMQLKWWAGSAAVDALVLLLHSSLMNSAFCSRSAAILTPIRRISSIMRGNSWSWGAHPYQRYQQPSHQALLGLATPVVVRIICR
jgi:hypothetical protein